MTLSFLATAHGNNRMKERGIDLARAELAINNPDTTMPGNKPASRAFIDKEPPPPVKVVTSWPPDSNDRLRLITCYKLEITSNE